MTLVVVCHARTYYNCRAVEIQLNNIIVLQLPKIKRNVSTCILGVSHVYLYLYYLYSCKCRGDCCRKLQASGSAMLVLQRMQSYLTKQTGEYQLT